jgi:hypothetical protein
VSGDAATPEHRVLVTEREMLLDHDTKLDALIAWQNELKGAFAFMKVAFGTSILSAIVSIVALVVMLGTGAR